MMAELQDVFSTGWEDHVSSHPVTCQQEKVAHAIMDCRTSTLGGHIEVCDECGHTRISYNSCRNRHCPKCQTVRRDQWVQARTNDVLDCPYFHVVFTVPDCLHALIYSNQEQAYSALFRASADTLLECGADARRLGAKVGFTSVLHTSGQNLSYHPHIHAIVCAGGIDGHGAWRQSKAKFFIPVKVLSRVFRGKLTEALKGMGLTLAGEDDPKRIADIIALSWEREWVVYAKRPFRDAACVIEYLGRYTHRTAISNSRILAASETEVTFRWRDYRDSGKMKVMALATSEFIRRFLMHVLPVGFMRIRHYGFLSNNGKRERIVRLKVLSNTALRTIEKLSGLELACRLVGRDITKCPSCGGNVHKLPMPVLQC
jgi:hypothetical protein